MACMGASYFPVACFSHPVKMGATIPGKFAAQF
jgi:hypothetical protein